MSRNRRIKPLLVGSAIIGVIGMAIGGIGIYLGGLNSIQLPELISRFLIK